MGEHRRAGGDTTSSARGTIPGMLGVPVRVHDMSGDDLGVAHLPPPVEVGDLVALARGEYRVLDVVETGQTYPVAALVRAQPIHLPVVAR